MAANRHGRKATVEQHRRAAACLQVAREAVFQAMYELGVLNRSFIGGPPALPTKVKAHEVRRLSNAGKSIDRARSDLEDRMFEDHDAPRGSAEERDMLRIYYPGPNGPRGLTEAIERLIGAPAPAPGPPAGQDIQGGNERTNPP